MNALKRIVTAALLVCLLVGTNVAAQEMPSGPPEEMKKLASLEGEWDVVMEFNEGDTVETWVKSEGSCRYSYILGGAAMQMEFTSEYMQMPFHGLGVECFDRETGQWQMTWLDNMGARFTLYNGVHSDDRSVFTAEDIWQGQKYLSRISTIKESDTSFRWSMEMSMDGGKTWTESGKAVYTKNPK